MAFAIVLEPSTIGLGPMAPQWPTAAMAHHSRVQSSLRLAVRNLRPLASASPVKSSDQRWLAAIGHQLPSRPSREICLRLVRRSEG